MRKIILILLIFTIFSFSIVYAQETYSNDLNKNNQEMNAVKNAEIKNELAKDVEQNDEELKKAKLKEEEQKKEKQKEENSIKKEEVDSSSEIKSGQASPSKQSEKKEIIEKSNSTKKNVKADKQVQEEKVVNENNNKEVQETRNVDGSPVIDAGDANNGSFKAKYLSNKKIKIMVIKGGDRYTYDLFGDNTYQSYPLQLGDGLYKISIMENIDAKEYKYILTKEVEVKTNNPNANYLTSVQMINWNESMEAIKNANSLTKGLNEQQKIEKIYNYIINNIKYDNSITELPSGYIPNINNIYSQKKGICYDFASIFAGMLRSVGIPTKLIKGQASNVEGYHAWNEVNVNGSWKIVDTSYDSQLKAAGHSVALYKSGKDYSKSKQY